MPAARRTRRKPNPEDHWYVQRNIPVALIMAIAVQAATVIWWGSGVTNKLEAVNEDIKRLYGTVQMLIFRDSPQQSWRAPTGSIDPSSPPLPEPRNR